MGSYHAPKNTPRTGCIFASTLPTPNLNHSNQLQAHMQRNTPQCGVTKQCVVKESGAKMWRHRKMWRHQTMCRQRMWRQNVASQENVASPNNVAPNNVAPKCGVTGKCGVTKQCGAKQCSAKMWRHRKMRRHQTMWRQRRWRHMSSKCVFIMRLQRQVEKCVLFCQHRDMFKRILDTFPCFGDDPEVGTLLEFSNCLWLQNSSEAWMVMENPCKIYTSLRILGFEPE